MFEDALLESSPRRVSARRGINYLLAYVVEAMVVGALVLVPLINTLAIPRELLLSEVHLLPFSGGPAAPPSGRPMKTPPRPIVDLLHSRITIPPTITPIVETIGPPQEQVPSGPWIPGLPDGLRGRGGYIPGDVLVANQPPPPPEPVAHPEPHPTIVHLSKGVVAAKAVYQPKPVYPPLALIARIQGTVVMQAIIGKEGAIRDLKVISGHPLLVQAALDAVRTWRYQPTLLNDEPAEVLTEIDVNFILAQ